MFDPGLIFANGGGFDKVSVVITLPKPVLSVLRGNAAIFDSELILTSVAGVLEKLIEANTLLNPVLQCFCGILFDKRPGAHSAGGDMRNMLLLRLLIFRGVRFPEARPSSGEIGDRVVPVTPEAVSGRSSTSIVGGFPSLEHGRFCSRPSCGRGFPSLEHGRLWWSRAAGDEALFRIGGVLISRRRTKSKGASVFGGSSFSALFASDAPWDNVLNTSVVGMCFSLSLWLRTLP